MASIPDTCDADWPSSKIACNAFVIAVAADVGVTLTGIADQIVGQIQGADWTQLGHDGAAAAAAAADGKLVIGGLKAADTVPSPGKPQPTEGHVVVVIDGTLDHDLYPKAWWGSTDPDVREKGQGKLSINYAWNTASRDKVIYASHNQGS